MVQCLVMLRNKDVIESQYLIQSLFPLLISTSSKVMRSQIYSALVTLMKHSNTGTKNQKLNKQVQALLFNLLSDSESNGMWATKLTRELWRRGIWDDSRTVEIMTQAALSSNLKVASSAARFFLSSDKEREEAQEAPSSDEESFDLDALKHKMTVNKKTGRRGRKLEAAVKTVKKKNARISATYLNFSAIHLLRDPQGFAESLFSNNLSGKNCNKLDLEQKILFTNLVSRLVGVHKLILLGIYSFFLKYLTPKQRDVTQFMAAAAQSCHDLVPPESVTPMVKKIADEFVSDGVQAEVAAAGINTIREIASRAPLAIDADMLQDLTEYKGSKSKPVVMAARSLISLYRDIAPEMLNRKDRGKIATMEMSAGDRSDVRYGVETTNVTVSRVLTCCKSGRRSKRSLVRPARKMRNKAGRLQAKEKTVTMMVVTGSRSTVIRSTMFLTVRMRKAARARSSRFPSKSRLRLITMPSWRWHHLVCSLLLTLLSLMSLRWRLALRRSWASLPRIWHAMKIQLT